MKTSSVALLLALAACEGAPVVPAPVRRAHDAGLAIDAAARSPAIEDPYRDTTALECGRCHERALREWQGSGHHRSFTSPLFQAEHEHGGSPWCESCHAPRGVERAGDGVDCVSCHVRGGFIVSAHVSGDAPHPTHYDESWTREGACAHCHQFEFDDESGLLLQQTVDEWRASGREESCVDCHMGDSRSHVLGGARDPRLLRRALDVNAEAITVGLETIVRVTMRAANAGHAVPTGDIARTLRVCARGSGPERCVELRRNLTLEHGRRALGADDRVPPTGERTVAIRLPRARHVRWSVEMYTAPFRPSDRDRLDGVRLEFPIAEGRVRAVAQSPVDPASRAGDNGERVSP